MIRIEKSVVFLSKLKSKERGQKTGGLSSSLLESEEPGASTNKL